MTLTGDARVLANASSLRRETRLQDWTHQLTVDGLTQWHPAFLELGKTCL
ncbi:hypothetical protein [Nostoc sp.]